MTSQAKLNFGTDKATGRPTQYPLISVENVFVFPGERHFVIIFLSAAHMIRRTSSSFAVWNWVSPLHCSFLHKDYSTFTPKADTLQNVFQESQNFYGKPSTTSALSSLALENRFDILCWHTMSFIIIPSSFALIWTDQINRWWLMLCTWDKTRFQSPTNSTSNLNWFYLRRLHC